MHTSADESIPHTACRACAAHRRERLIFPHGRASFIDLQVRLDPHPRVLVVLDRQLLNWLPVLILERNRVAWYGALRRAYQFDNLLAF